MGAPEPNYEPETVPCALCGSEHYEIYLQGVKELYNDIDAWFDIVRCRRCGFVFTNPRPSPATIGGFYPDSARYYQPDARRLRIGIWSRKKWKQTLQKSVVSRRFAYPLPRVSRFADILPSLLWHNKLRLTHLPHFVPGGRLLDIGCAWGGYLWRMKELGWEVHGIELNAAAARYAREELGLANVRSGSFDDIDYPEETFDVVHMSMVLEHLYEPAAALGRINKLLRPGGQFILSVPDISGFPVRLFRDKCYTLQVPQHLSHFSPHTLREFLRQSGFEVEEILHQRNKKDFTKSAGYLENKVFARILNHSLVRGVVLDAFIWILSFLGKTSRMSVFARKRHSP